MIFPSVALRIVSNTLRQWGKEYSQSVEVLWPDFSSLSYPKQKQKGSEQRETPRTRQGSRWILTLWTLEGFSESLCESSSYSTRPWSYQQEVKPRKTRCLPCMMVRGQGVCEFHPKCARSLSSTSLVFYPPYALSIQRPYMISLAEPQCSVHLHTQIIGLCSSVPRAIGLITGYAITSCRFLSRP